MTPPPSCPDITPMTPPTPCSDISLMTLQLAPGLHLCWFSQTHSWSEADPFSACSMLWPRRIKHLCLVFSALHPLLSLSFSPSLSYSGVPSPASSLSLGRAHHLHLQCCLPSPPWLTLHLSGFCSGVTSLGTPFLAPLYAGLRVSPSSQHPRSSSHTTFQGALGTLLLLAKVDLSASSTHQVMASLCLSPCRF